MYERFSLKGKVAVVTGATGTFGTEFCHSLAGSGADIVLAVRNAEKGEELAEKLRNEQGVDTLVVAWNANDVASIKLLAEKARAFKGHVDVLVCNAGGNSNTSKHHFFDRSDYDIRATVETNLLSVLFCCREFGRIMKAQGFGSIINIASIAGVIGRDRRLYAKCGGGFENLVDYAASKGGIISATRDLAAVLAPYGVRVNSISPGGFDNGCSDIFRKHYGEETPLGRMGKGGCELGGAALFLASEAASYVTGHNLVVDGGYTIW